MPDRHVIASRPKFARYFAPEACERLLAFLRARSEDYPLGDIPARCRDPKDDYLLEERDGETQGGKPRSTGCQRGFPHLKLQTDD